MYGPRFEPESKGIFENSVCYNEAELYTKKTVPVRLHGCWGPTCLWKAVQGYLSLTVTIYFDCRSFLFHWKLSSLWVSDKSCVTSKHLTYDLTKDNSFSVFKLFGIHTPSMYVLHPLISNDKM